jgi:hypothetical protein
MHSFWHDNIEDENTRNKLQRRIKRFLGLAKEDTRKLLFVRTAVVHEELEDSEKLYKALEKQFGKAGREVWLLIICEDQQMRGPIRHGYHERLLHWLQPTQGGKLSTTSEGTAPYEEGVGFALRYILGDASALATASQAPKVANCSEIVVQGSPFLKMGAKPCEAGMWCGRVQLRGGDPQGVMFCAFEGHSEREVPWVFG